VAAAAGSPSRPSLAASSSAPESSLIRDLDSDAASLCSSRPATAGAGVGAAPNFSDRPTQAAALRVVNRFLAPDVALRGPLPAARDIQAALRLLVEVTNSALKSPGTPHSWPVVLAVLHWLTLLCYAQGDDLDAPRGPSNDLLLYIPRATPTSYRGTPPPSRPSTSRTPPKPG
jgi:kinetochore protein NDC80